MVDFVTLSQAKHQCRIDEDSTVDDEYLGLLISAASEVIADYVTDEITDPPQARIKQATLITVEHLYRERSGSNEFAVPEQYGYGYLPTAAVSLLFSLRKPTAL